MGTRKHLTLFRAVALVTPVILAACVRPSAEHPRTSQPPTAQWLVGSWSLKGRSCDGDGAIVYRADGSWIAEGATGTWRLRKDRLQTCHGR